MALHSVIMLLRYHSLTHSPPDNTSDWQHCTASPSVDNSM